jgi:Na+/alanine symporter
VENMCSSFFYISILFFYYLTSNIHLQSTKYISLSLLELTGVLFTISMKALACVRIMRYYRMISEERFGKDKEGHAYGVIMDSVLLFSWSD